MKQKQENFVEEFSVISITFVANSLKIYLLPI